ncbi:MOSC domain-containing protein [Neomoorella humiferrea]|uniref:MOSC domain-containing protein n=1 Tax=Neomoorella humiferrea TaxID=676965 RepID=UPI003D8C050C
MSTGKVIGVNLSARRGTKKINVGSGYLLADYGLQGDAHAGTSRQVSIFMAERAEELAGAIGLPFQPGDFAENITVQGINLEGIKVGHRILVGEAIVEITQIGKKDDESSSFSFLEPAPLKTEGIYCRVVKSGWVKTGDWVTIIT